MPLFVHIIGHWLGRVLEIIVGIECVCVCVCACVDEMRTFLLRHKLASQSSFCPYHASLGIGAAYRRGFLQSYYTPCGEEESFTV